jgi:hypothetical protein
MRAELIDHAVGVDLDRDWITLAVLEARSAGVASQGTSQRPATATTRPSALGGEAFVDDLRTRLAQTRLERNTAHLRTYIGDDLRPGLTMREAAQRYFAISSPELYDLMTQQLGWSAAHHQRWLADTAAHDLLGRDVVYRKVV